MFHHPSRSTIGLRAKASGKGTTLHREPTFLETWTTPNRISALHPVIVEKEEESSLQNCHGQIFCKTKNNNLTAVKEEFSSTVSSQSSRVSLSQILWFVTKDESRTMSLTTPKLSSPNYADEFDGPKRLKADLRQVI